MKKIILALGLTTFLLGCAAPVERMAQTPSGRPEVVFSTRSAAAVSEKLVGLCASKGILVQKSASNEVVCGGTMTGGDAVLAQILIGNSYSTTPERYVRFTIFPYQGKTRVQAYQWVETQMAFGQVNKNELNGNAQFNDILKALMSAGGKPVGTVSS